MSAEKLNKALRTAKLNKHDRKWFELWVGWYGQYCRANSPGRIPVERDLVIGFLRQQKSRAIKRAIKRDEAARMLYAKEEGREEGREKGRKEGEARGEQMGRIRLLQQMLGMSESSSEELSSMDLAALEAFAGDLQSQLRSRG